MRITLPVLTLILAQTLCHPSITIGGFTYDHVDPGPEFTQRPRPAQDWSPPAPSGAEARSSTMVYRTPDPGDYKPYRIPKAEEHATSLSTFLAQGEDEPVCFGIHALEALEGVSVNVDLKGAPLAADVRNMFFWPQRTGWRSRQWYMTPELLLPCQAGKTMAPTHDGLLEWRPFNVKANETAAFWITLTAGVDANPGVYEASVTVSSTGKPDLAIPLTVEVLPFKLARPADRSWLLYADTARWRRMSDQQVEAELRDFARHGMTGLVEMPLGSVDLSKLKEGKVGFDAASYTKLARQCREAGLPGPHVCHYGIAGRVRDALGLNVDLPKAVWPQELVDGIAAVSRAAVQATKDDPSKWYFYGVDEPRGDNTFAIQQYQSWHAGGAQTYATFGDPSFLQKATEYLTAPCFVVGLASRENSARSAREACANAGAEFWWYGTGSYVNPAPQEAFMFANRYGAGYLFWKTGAKAQVSWTFCRPHEDVFNDFDGIRANKSEPKEQATSYPHLLKPGDYSTYQGAIPTIAWESLREGVDDYTYLHMLQSLIAEARQSEREAARRAGKKAEGTLEVLVRTIPWVNPMNVASSSQEGFDAMAMQRVRRAVANLILELQAALAGKPAPGSARAPARVTLTVKTAGPSGRAADSLPIIGITRTEDPPAIDGKLDDACWQSASGRVSGFSFHRTGDPVTEVNTVAAACYDGKALYVSFACEEPAMDKLVARQKGHDQAGVWLDDGIEFFLDPTGRREKYAHFILNTNGSLYDEINQDPAWNPELLVGVSKRQDGWDVELAVRWSDLAAGGLKRSPIMALNFCRSRFAASQQSPHSTWACTFGGFHRPERFGIGLLQEGPVALTGIDLPRLWGPQTLNVRLRNLTDEPVRAFARAQGNDSRVNLQPGEERELAAPVVLDSPGQSEIRFAWGVAGSRGSHMRLLVRTPEPIEMAPSACFIKDGGKATVIVRVNVPPAAAAAYRILIETDAGKIAARRRLAAVPGQTHRRVLTLPTGMGEFAIQLLDDRGRPVTSALLGRIFALPL